MSQPFMPWIWPAPMDLGTEEQLREIERESERKRASGAVPSNGADRRDVVGYQVHATDGDIGKVDEASYEVGDSRLVVDTGPWIFGSKVVLPAGIVREVDHEDRKIYVSCTKDQVKDSPEYDPGQFDSPEHREKVAEYYGSLFRPL